MSSRPVQGSMRQVLEGFYQKLINDEELLRLLYYYPEDETRPSPLSKELPDIIGSDIYWDVVDERILDVEKDSDLKDKPLCRIYITPERRRSVFGNYLQAKQGVEVAVFVHEDYSTDKRIEWISDRVFEILSMARINGAFGMIEYVKGDPWVAPVQYQQYKHVFEYYGEKNRTYRN